MAKNKNEAELLECAECGELFDSRKTRKRGAKYCPDCEAAIRKDRTASGVRKGRCEVCGAPVERGTHCRDCSTSDAD